MLCFLVTSVLRFALLLYYRQTSGVHFKKEKRKFKKCGEIFVVVSQDCNFDEHVHSGLTITESVTVHCFIVMTLFL